jgi:hypothetical protein
MDAKCPKCSGTMEPGVTATKGLLGSESSQPPQIVFLIPGTATSRNPIKAFQQGLSEAGDRRYGIAGMRCSGCGYLEFLAKDIVK